MKDAMFRQETPKSLVDILSAIIGSDDLYLHIKMAFHICIEILEALENPILVAHQIYPSHVSVAIDKGHKIIHTINGYNRTCPYI
jgi:hypothetical protein